MRKLKVFIGSSQEAEAVVRQLILGLDTTFRVLPWYEAFPDSKYTLERLAEITSDVDLAIFVFAKDDKRTKRKRTAAVPRDNVVLEYGLFLGALGRGRVFILKDSTTDLPTDLTGLTLSLLKGSPSAKAAQITDFATTLRKRGNIFPPRPESSLADLDDGGLGVTGTIVSEHRKLLENAHKLDKSKKSEFLQFESNSACVETYIEALGHVRNRFWTTTFVSSGFWIHRDRSIIYANADLLKRLGGNKQRPNVRRLFLTEKSPKEELEFIRRRLVHLRQQNRVDEASEITMKLTQLRKNILALAENRCEIKVAQDSGKSSKQISDIVPFDPNDSEIALYDNFRVDIFSGGRRGRIDDVKIYSEFSNRFRAVKSAVEEYFELLWNDSTAEDASYFVKELKQIETLAARHISYTSNWLARFEFHLNKRDYDLKVVELNRLSEELRGELSLWGKVQRYLDIGTCTARYPISLRDSVIPKGVIIGLDSDEDCVAFARANVGHKALGEKRIVIKEGDFLSPMVELGGNFDLITCMLGTLSHFGWDDNVLKAALRRMSTELSSTGVLILSNWSAEACEKRDLLEIYNNSDRKNLADWTPTLVKLKVYLQEVGLALTQEIQPDPRLNILVCRRVGPAGSALSV